MGRGQPVSASRRAPRARRGGQAARDAPLTSPTDARPSPPSARRLVTGSYHRRLHIFEPDGSARTTIEADKHVPPTVTQLRSPRRGRAPPADGPIEPHSRVLFHSHHPQLDLLAIAASNSLYMFAAS